MSRAQWATPPLELAPGLEIPAQAITRTFGLLAVRGAGKSNTAAVMAEEMHAKGLPFVAIDPVGSWYGLRSSGDGNGPGLPIPIFGGKHGDVPLTRDGGELVADLIVERRLSCILDLSEFESEADKKAFLLAFARRLYKRNESPLHLFLEEADDYIPQKPIRDEVFLLRAFENIVRRGRSRGLGITFITQRSAVLNKNVLTQVETLFVMRTTGPQDRDAVEAWVKYHDAGREMLPTLANLKDGEAWVWSPHFLGVMGRFQIRKRRTFDSGATPANVRADDARTPATLAELDVEGLRVAMAATLEKAEAEDPKRLREQLADARRNSALLAAQVADLLKRPLNLQRVEVKVVPRELMTAVRVMEQDADDLLEQLAAIELALEKATRLARSHRDGIGECVAHFATFQTDGEKAPGWEPQRPAAPGTFLRQMKERIVGRNPTHIVTDEYSPPARAVAGITAVEAADIAFRTTARDQEAEFVELGPRKRLPRTGSPVASPGAVSPALGLTGPEERILEALAELWSIRVAVPERVQVAFFAGYSHPRTKGFTNALGKLRTAGFLEYVDPGRLRLTRKGDEAVAGDKIRRPTPAALQARIVELLGNVTGRILGPLVKAYPAAVKRSPLAAEAGYEHPRSKGFTNALGRLRSLGFIDYDSAGGVRATSTLFLE